MRRAFWRRALKVYLSQAATLLFLFTVIAGAGPAHRPAGGEEPGVVLPGAAARRLSLRAAADLRAGAARHPADVHLLHAAEPLGAGLCAAPRLGGGDGGERRRCGRWRSSASANGSTALAVRWTGLPVPFHEMGAFNTFAWQFLWFAGLWIGASRNAPDAKPLRFPRWLLVLAGAARALRLLLAPPRHQRAGAVRRRRRAEPAVRQVAARAAAAGQPGGAGHPGGALRARR